jgi:hypothetical protein
MDIFNWLEWALSCSCSIFYFIPKIMTLQYINNAVLAGMDILN